MSTKAPHDSPQQPKPRPASHLATALAAWRQGLEAWEEGRLVVRTEVWA